MHASFNSSIQCGHSSFSCCHTLNLPKTLHSSPFNTGVNATMSCKFKMGSHKIFLDCLCTDPSHRYPQLQVHPTMSFFKVQRVSVRRYILALPVEFMARAIPLA